MKARLAGAMTLASIFGLVLPSSSTADFFDTDVTYTTDADFDLGTLVSVNHDAPFGDQLQLDSPTRPFPFINVAASGRGTVVRVNTDTGEVLGEYRTAPEGYGLDPSRTTVDLFGNVWTGNRGEDGAIDGVPHGSAVKIGLVVGGTRVDAGGTPAPTGGYLAPPYDYSTCVDRDDDGLLRTSNGLLDVLDWPDRTDGVGGADGSAVGIVEDAVDECIIVYQRLADAEAPRHLSVDANNDVWVGGYPFTGLRMFHLLDGTTGAIIDSFDARDFGCGGYGGLIDGNGVLWSIGHGWGEGPLLRYDPTTREGRCVNTSGGYGLGIDTNGYLWASIWENGIVKVSPDGVVEPGYPKSTWLPPAPPPAPFASTASATFDVAATASPRPTAQLQLERMPAAFLTALAPVDGGDFWVAPDDDWVGSMTPWTPGTTVTLTINDGSDDVYAADQTVDEEGNFNFNLWDVFDIQRGHIVTITDDDAVPTTKVHGVLDLYVDGIDVTAETVFGRATPGSTVDVWVHEVDVSTTATADGSGNWTADFTGLTDLGYGSNGGSSQTDDDGDATGVWWAGPTFVVAPDDDWVGSSTSWTPGTTVTMTIDDGSGVVYSDSQIVDDGGQFNFNLWNEFDLRRGHTVSVFDGTITKVHTVLDLDVTSIDLDFDTVSGVATPGIDVHVWDHQDDANVTVSPDGSGNWTADFTGQTDLTGSSDGNSQQTDADGDATWDFWSLPRFTVSPDDDWVGASSRWAPGATVTMTIEVGSGVVYSDSQTTDVGGHFNFNLWDVFDIERGHTVTVTDGTTTKTHVVADLFVDSVDPAADTLLGRAPAGASIDVWTDDGVGITPVADGAGNWVADFSTLTDLTHRSNGEALTADDDGDATTVWWAGATFAVSPDHDWIGSTGRWTPGAPVIVTIDDGGAGYGDTQTVDGRGQFNFHLGDVFDVERGHTVTVSDGTTTKTHTVLDLFADGVNPAADTVFGRAAPFTDIQVWVHDTEANLVVGADGDGDWRADFTGVAELTSSSQGDAAQYDDDGDSTQAPWQMPRFTAAPDDEWVGSNSPWTRGSTVTLTIDDGGAGYTDSQVVDPDGNFSFHFGGVFDLRRGHTVTVTDGVVTKTHEVLGLHVDTIDVDLDRLIGRATPGIDVEIWVHDTEVNVMVTPDGAGNWIADLAGLTDLTYASNGGSQQSDDDGDTTGVWWATPGFVVSPDDEWIESSGRWTPGAPLIVTVDDEFGTEVYRDETTVDPDGYFHIEWGGMFDLLRGHTVTVTDGATTKVHDVFDLWVDVIDLTGDVLSGRAAAGTTVDVWVHDVEGAQVTVSPDGTGAWTADFSGLADLTHESHGATQQTDADGDATHVGWQSPRFRVDIDNEQIEGEGWARNAEIVIHVDGFRLLVSEPVFTDPGGSFGIGVPFDLLAGQLVVVTDGERTKELLLTDPTVTDLDVAADVVTGTGTPGAGLDVWASVDLWSEGSLRRVTADGGGDWAADFSVPADDFPTLDLVEGSSVTMYEWDFDGDATIRHFGPPIQANRGVAVTPVDNHVWVANSNTNTVTRLDNDGEVIAVIDVGEHPTGVAVDAAGKVWVTNLGADSTMRIDPDAGPLGLGEVDLTVHLGEGASPYNYSDMTGAVVVGSTSPQGFWTVVQDSGMAGFEWGRITWNTEPEAFEPAGSAIVVEARTADSEAALAGQAFQPVVNGELFSSLGRYIEVRVTLKASPDHQSPVLSDIRIQRAVIEVDVDIKPGSDPNSINLRRSTGVVPVAILGSAEFDVVTVDATSLRFGPDMAAPAHDIVNRPGHFADVDEDGFVDMVSHYRIGDIGLELIDTEACLTGVTLDGTPIEGCDSVRVFWRNR